MKIIQLSISLCLSERPNHIGGGGFDSGYDELCFRLSSEDTARVLGLKIGESRFEDVRQALGSDGVDLNSDGSVYDFFDAADNILKVYFKNGVLRRIAYEGAAAG